MGGEGWRGEEEVKVEREVFKLLEREREWGMEWNEWNNNLRSSGF